MEKSEQSPVLGIRKSEKVEDEADSTGTDGGHHSPEHVLPRASPGLPARQAGDGEQISENGRAPE